MSQERLFKWTCDTCLNHRLQGPHGLPEGWRWYHTPAGVQHACARCVLVREWPKGVLKTSGVLA